MFPVAHLTNARSDLTLPWWFPARATATRLNTRRLVGRMDRCSELTSAAETHTQRDFHLECALESNRTAPTDAGLDGGTNHVGVHTRIDFVIGCAA